MGKSTISKPPAAHIATSGKEEYFQVEKVDIGDHIKIKQCLDEAACSSILEMGHTECLKMDNLKIVLMIVACCFAMVAQVRAFAGRFSIGCNSVCRILVLQLAD